MIQKTRKNFFKLYPVLLKAQNKNIRNILISKSTFIKISNKYYFCKEANMFTKIYDSDSDTDTDSDQDSYEEDSNELKRKMKNDHDMSNLENLFQNTHINKKKC